jgi:ADP-ribosylglycohydrolase
VVRGDKCRDSSGAGSGSRLSDAWRGVPGLPGAELAICDTYVRDAYRQGCSVRDACDAWYSGAYLLETVPSVLYILMRHGDDLEDAIVHAINDTVDNDTIEAIVGAAVGALHGEVAIPQRWLAKLSGRTTEQVEGKIWALLDQARCMWWTSGQLPDGDRA